MNKTLTVFLSGIICLLNSFSMNADEGMWLPSLIGNRIHDMQAKGFRLTAEDIYSINQASLKDAVVLFGRGCTGELISSEGLLLTNHHCGYGQIQQHSSVEHDYLRDGFWAMTRKEELPNKNLTVSFLDRMEDVTEIVTKDCSSEMTESERTKAINKASQKLIDEVKAKGNGLQAKVEALYYGNQYFLFVYRVFSDIRLVGAPPSSIGKFGGDTDNWMWPRHTGDFSIFRIYADKDNNPAEYSEDNVPYTPKKYFKISTSGVKEGDFTFIYGFPGRTQEYIMSEGVRYIEEISDPHKINLRTKRLDIIKRYMESDRKIRIQYSAKCASISNAWKKWQGEVKGIKKMKTVAEKQRYEADFAKWAVGTEYEGLIEKIGAIYAEMEPLNLCYDYYTETARTIEIVNFVSKFLSFYKASEDVMTFDAAKAADAAASFYKDYHLPIDKECFVAVMTEFDRNISKELQPEYFRNQMQHYGNDVQAWADELFSTTLFADPEKVAGLTSADLDMIKNDPAYKYGKEFHNWYMTIYPDLNRLNEDLKIAYRNYMRGQMDYAEDLNGKAGLDAFYPDANLTLRVAYGHVKGYNPADGVYYKPYSTLEGIIEKDNPEIFDYNIPQRLRDIYETKDYGRWTNGEGKVPVCFIATNHTTGGNSGSPVINADGNLIGINFDRVWEGTMSDIVFDPEICRNIALDIRYVLFTIDKVAGAGYLLDEMTFVE